MKYLMLLGFAIISFCMSLSALITTGQFQEIHLNCSQGRWESTALIGFIFVSVGIIIIPSILERCCKNIEEVPSLLAGATMISIFFPVISSALLQAVSSRGWVELADIFISLIFVFILSNQYYGLKTMRKFFTFKNP